MSKRPKITHTVARILAERVKDRLTAEAKEFCKNYIDKVKDSKDYVKLQKLVTKRNAIVNKMNAEISNAEQVLKNSYSNSIAKVNVSSYYTSDYPSLSVREADSIQTDYIRDTILLKDFYAESGLSHDQIVDELVKEFMKTAKTM